MKYKYFVTYTAHKSDQSVFGNIEIVVDHTIESIQDLREIEEMLEKNNKVTSCIIIFYKSF